MAKFTFEIIADDDGADEKEVAIWGLAAIEAAIAINMTWLKRHPEEMCSLACGKIKYDSKNKDVLSLIADIKTAPILIKVGKGLCIDIVALDVAIKRTEGKRAWPAIHPQKTEKEKRLGSDASIFHVVTEYIGYNNKVMYYDPSYELEHIGKAVNHQPDFCTACI